MKFTTLFGAAIAGLVLAGCGGSGNGIINVPNPRVVFVNDFTGVSSANFQAGSDTVSGIAYNSASQTIITQHGTKDVSAGQATTSDLVTQNNVLFEENKRYTVVGWGDSGSRTLGIYENDKSNSANGTVSARVIDAAAGSGSVDVYITDAAAGNGLPGSPSFAAVTAGTATDYVSIPDSGPITIRVRVFAAGTTAPALADTTFALTDRTRVSLVTSVDTLPLVNVLKLQDSL